MPEITPLPPPAIKMPPATDDQVRRDGGNSTAEEPVPPANLEKIKENAVDHTKDEPGS